MLLLKFASSSNPVVKKKEKKPWKDMNFFPLGADLFLLWAVTGNKVPLL